MSEPFSEEDIEDELKHNWLDHYQIHFHQLHASRHMNRQQIIRLVNDINPKTCFPIHTENQLLFRKSCKQIKPINMGYKFVDEINSIGEEFNFDKYFILHAFKVFRDHAIS